MVSRPSDQGYGIPINFSVTKTIPLPSAEYIQVLRPIMR